MPPRQRCKKCRADKKKCSGEKPCARCRALGATCVLAEVNYHPSKYTALIAGNTATTITNTTTSSSSTSTSNSSPSAPSKRSAPTPPRTSDGQVVGKEEREPEPQRQPRTVSIYETSFVQSSYDRFRLAAISVCLGPFTRYPFDSTEVARPIESAFARQYPVSGIETPLKFATDAWAFRCLAQTKRCPETKVFALQAYGQAVRTTQVALENLSQDPRDLERLVLAVFALSMFESVSNAPNRFDRARAHTDGLLDLITQITKMLDMGQIKTMTSLPVISHMAKLLYSARKQTVSDRGFPYGDIPVDHLNPGDRFAQIFINSGYGDFSSFRFRHIERDDMIRNAVVNVQEILAFERKLVHWHDSLPPSWRQPIRIKRSSHRSDKPTWPPYAYVYPDPLAAMLINRYRNWRLFTLDAIRVYSQYTDLTPFGITPGYVSSLESLLRCHATDICATMFSLFDRNLIDEDDDTTDLPPPSLPYERFPTGQPAISSAYCFGALEPYQRKWIETCLLKMRSFFYHTLVTTKPAQPVVTYDPPSGKFRHAILKKSNLMEPYPSPPGSDT